MSRPNILLAISDDQAWPFASAYGCSFVDTPAFDRVAATGALFTHGYCPAPQCSPSRAALIAGRNIWELEEAGTHASYFPRHFNAYTELLKNAGYKIGYTGKGWGPGDWETPGWPTNPAGPLYEGNTLIPPTTKISKKDYAANFNDFLNEVDDEPFCFWYGCHSPHRGYEAGSGLRLGKSLEDVEVPPFLPDCEIVRSDLLDYAVEIEWFDDQLGLMLEELEKRGQLSNTIVVVTGDNGMPFPKAKANTYELGVHVPLAISWPEGMAGGRTVEDFVSFIDLGPTFLDLAGVEVPEAMSGRSLRPVIESDQSGWVTQDRTFVVTGRERHTHARHDNLGYPIRSIRNDRYLYIRNLSPDLWPAGPTFNDVDGSPSKKYLIDHQDDETVRPYFDGAFAKRPLEELFDMKEDPGCLNNLAEDEALAEIKAELWATLEKVLREQEDPRILGYGDLFDSYPRLSPMRPELGGFAESAYNPEYLDKARAAMERMGMPPERIHELCDKSKYADT